MPEDKVYSKVTVRLVAYPFISDDVRIDHDEVAKVRSFMAKLGGQVKEVSCAKERYRITAGEYPNGNSA